MGAAAKRGWRGSPVPFLWESFRDGLQVGKEPAPHPVCLPPGASPESHCPLLCESSGPSFTSAQAEIWRDGALVTGVAMHPTGTWLAWHTPCR